MVLHIMYTLLISCTTYNVLLNTRLALPSAYRHVPLLTNIMAWHITYHIMAHCGTPLNTEFHSSVTSSASLPMGYGTYNCMSFTRLEDETAIAMLHRRRDVAGAPPLSSRRSHLPPGPVFYAPPASISNRKSKSTSKTVSGESASPKQARWAVAGGVPRVLADSPWCR